MSIDQIMQSGADKIDNLVREYSDDTRGRNIQNIKLIIEDTVNNVFSYRPSPSEIDRQINGY